jgi:hypothetical protein
VAEGPLSAGLLDAKIESPSIVPPRRNTMEKGDTRLPAELAETAERAARFAESPELVQALGTAAGDPRLWREASENPDRFLESQGVRMPDGLGLEFLDDPLRGRPAPDYEFFSIRLFNCRTYWVKKEGGGYEKVEICRGFEIVPHPLPPIA